MEKKFPVFLITALVIGYLVFWMLILIFIGGFNLFTFFCMVVTGCIIGAFIVNLRARLQELKEQEKDDLSKY